MGNFPPFQLGVDFGTQSVRCGVVDMHGRMLSSAECFYKTFYPMPGRAEQNPMEWWTAFETALSLCLSKLAKADIERIASMTVCATSSTLLAVDKDGEPMGNAILWMDSRALDEAKIINETKHEVLRACGGEESVEWMTSKSLWIKRNQKDVYANCYKLLEQLDWINFKLTGRWCSSICNATCKWNYVQGRGGWQAEFYKEIGLEDFDQKWPTDVLKLGEPIGECRAELLEHFDLKKGLTVYQGGIDAHLNAVGLGVVSDSSMALITGTSFCHIGFSKEPVDIKGIWGPYDNAVVPGYYCLEGGQVSAGSLTKWFVDVFSVGGDNPYGQMAQEAEQVAIGSDGLVVLDFFQGNRTPYKDPKATGTIFGLTLKHERQHIYRAILESVALGTKNILSNFERQGIDVQKLVLSGGGTKNKLWLRIISDCTGKELHINENTAEAGILGCAITAAVGSGVYDNFSSAAKGMVRAKQRILPNMENYKAYAKVFDTYIDLYESLKHIMHKG